MSQRDAFINRLFEHAKNDKDIVFISVDMGATSLDRWRKELPDQFLYAGISEQNAINVAAGLSAAGKKVYVYFMAAWACRCLEQIRYSCAMGGNPITVLGNGVGLGYSPAGPAHNPTEDIAYMSSINHMELLSPASAKIAEMMADLTVHDRALRYIRLERSYHKELDKYDNISPMELKSGMRVIGNNQVESESKVAILSYGYLLGRALDVMKQFSHTAITVVDLFRVKPVPLGPLIDLLDAHHQIITLEEQTLSGGFGSAVCAALSDVGLSRRVIRMGLPERYIFENASRDYLLDNNNLSVDSIVEQVNQLAGMAS